LRPTLCRFKGKSDKSLLAKLDSINQELKKYSHVNKKALEQFITSSDQQKKLLERLEDIDHGKEVKYTLISVTNLFTVNPSPNRSLGHEEG
jgi:structural maintenance of chromosome 3 (chondroitin sulfate proteoglycan 6)